jgi:plastocyanin
MKKYFLAGLLIIVLAGAALVWTQLAPKSAEMNVKPTGRETSFTVHALKEQWRWDLQDLEVAAGDHVTITFVNEDDFDHGIGLAVFGINQRLPANSTTTVDFVATRRGTFDFYCTIPCGQGDVNGQTRDHFDMIGTLKVS